MKQLKLMKTLLVAVGLLLRTSAWAQISDIPYSSVFSITEEETTIGSILPFVKESGSGTVSAVTGTNLGADNYVLAVRNATAAAYFDTNALTDGNQPYTIKSKETVTISYTAYHGYLVNNKSATFSVLNSSGETLVSYTYNLTNSTITDVKIGGNKPDNFEEFAYRSSNSNGTSLNGLANYVTGDCNPKITITISGDGNVSINFYRYVTKTASTTNNTYSGTLNYTMDLASIKVQTNGDNDDRRYCIDDLNITSQYGYNVKAINSTSKVINSSVTAGKVDKGANVTIAYPAYILSGTTLYNISNNGTGDYYRKSITPDGSNDVVLTYNGTSVSDVVFYTEAENVSGATTTSQENRSSNGYLGYTGGATTYLKAVDLPAGTYKVYWRAFNGNASDRTGNFKIGDKVFEFTHKKSATSTGSTEEFTIDAFSTLYFASAGSGNKGGTDYFYVKGTPNNTIVGALDFSTEANGEHSDDYTMKPGDTKVFTFQNHGTTFGNNWRIGVKQGETWKANVCADSYDYTNSTATNVTSYQMSKDDGSSKVGIDWNDFATDMADANVVATLTYGTDGTLAIRTTSTGAANGYIYYVDHDVTGLTGDITINLSVNHSWLEILSVEQTKVGMTIGDATWASFSNANEVAIPSGVTAYYASASDGSSVTLKPIDGDYIPANTGVVLNGTAGTYSADVTSTSAAIAGTNLLHPWLTAGTPSEETYYTLAAGPTFKRSTGGILAAGKAYLVLPTSARELSVVFDNETNGIQQVESAAQSKGAYYNLAGQRVAQPTKGLYIVNGKKVVIK